MKRRANMVVAAAQQLACRQGALPLPLQSLTWAARQPPHSPADQRCATAARQEARGCSWLPRPGGTCVPQASKAAGGAGWLVTCIQEGRQSRQGDHAMPSCRSGDGSTHAAQRFSPVTQFESYTCASQNTQALMSYASKRYSPPAPVAACGSSTCGGSVRAALKQAPGSTK